MNDKKSGAESQETTVPLTQHRAEQQLKELYGSVLDRRKRISLLVYHRGGAHVFPLDPGRPLVLGRGESAQVSIADRSLSRDHARFWQEDGKVWVEDLGSTNGTRVNGEPVQRCQVRKGDEVGLGSVVVAIQSLSAAEHNLFGLDGHDAFVNGLELELERAAATGGLLALVLLRSGRGVGIERWCPAVRRRLRSFDRAALYSPDSVELLLPQVTAGEAATLAAEIRGDPGISSALLLCGVAGFPEAGASAEELLEGAREALRQAGAGQPLRQASSRRRRTLTGCHHTGALQPLVASEAMRRLYRTVDRVATSAAPVLVQGDTGTGKEVVARAIHERSPRSGGPMICVNCGAIPPTLVESTLFGHERGAFTGAVKAARGVFEAAHTGSVMLDELGELPAEAQAALLRVLETRRVVRVGSTREREVDVRVIAATNRDLEAMCEAGAFRQDLYYRLNVVQLKVPPLCQRRDEILPLAELFRDEACRSNGRPRMEISLSARALLEAHGWPGNVRELKNAMERAVVISDGKMISEEDLPARVREGAGTPALPVTAGDGSSQAPRVDVAAPPEAGGSGAAGAVDLKDQVKQYEARLIRQALDRASWNIKLAAEALNLPVRTLNYKIKQLKIPRTPERG